MRFFGWIFLIFGVLNVLFMPIFALALIVVGILLISFGRKGKDRRLARKARKMRYKAAKARKEGMSRMNDIFQVDYLPEKKEIRINLPEEVWRNIDTIIMTRLLQEELVVEKQKEGEDEDAKN